MTGPIVLVVLDGYGIGDGGTEDATRVAHSPFLHGACSAYPSAQLETSGEAVGLPAGQMGNSEVGHMTMGAGRIIEQDLTRITNAFQSTPAEDNSAIRALFDAIDATGGSLHLMGLVSDGGVHSHVDHLRSILAASQRRGISTAIHAFLDGRDTPPRSALGFLRDLLPLIDRSGAHIATVSGRYFAMDRDTRWERVIRAYDAIVCREGPRSTDPIAAIQEAYARDESDEFVVPTVIDGGRALCDGDGVLFFNFRADRARELTNLISSAKPTRFAEAIERKRIVDLAGYLCLTEYDADFDLPVAFPTEIPRNVLGEIVAEADLAQLRIAETEKYAHVTFFFNSGSEEPFPGEERILVPSPRDIATYDHKPDMSAGQVTHALLKGIREGEYSFILVNFANPDMLGHTGVMDATVKAVEAIDACLERIAKAVLAADGQLLITADHGNCELMVDPESGEPHTSHTTNPVPIYWVASDTRERRLRDGTLADLAPTVLELMDLPRPEAMTGRSLIVGSSQT